MKIELPSISAQQKTIFELATQEAIETLQQNLTAPSIAPQTEIDETLYGREHLLRENEGYKAPHPDVIGAYFRHFQRHFPEYGTDGRLAALLGLSSDRRVREFKNGDRTIPYGIWRKFLVMTGRAPQDVIKVFANMG
ncbi:hypothetical protein HZU75_04415 [Chitinibacter fontanus]|uniref:Uncharacterized protein n=1 Tax=Chitinibacter fontanus TaxID=1737446 RepID=A0A7D5V8M1_9NEIS|nr:hypothetical protein [Chitinibacter fontanus]QLI80835.1 hypothetical protein HZU75_04415 [Chitinibacter fontanus]